MASTQNEPDGSPKVRHQPFKLTKSVVDRATAPLAGQLFLRDTLLKGFALRVTAGGAKSFVFEKRIAGKVRRLTLGRYGELTVEQARREATRLAGEIAVGRNPIAEREQARLVGTTLREAFEDFKEARKHLKPRTLYAYERLLKAEFVAWADKPLVGLTKDTVIRLHAKIGQERGEASANLAMQFLRSLFNFAMATYEDDSGRPLVPENPVIRLTQVRAWYHVRRRQTVIKVHQLSAWYAAVEALRADHGALGPTVADFLLMVLFTGLRREEAAQLRWQNVDLKAGTIYLPDPKNREPFLLPLSRFVVQLLERRNEISPDGYVFPAGGRRGYLVEPGKCIAKVIERAGVCFTIHDLRRTFITIAESIDIAPYAIKRMVNHKARGDVTSGYIVSDVERLRAPVEKMGEFLLKALGVMPTAQVISMKQAG